MWILQLCKCTGVTSVIAKCSDTVSLIAYALKYSGQCTDKENLIEFVVNHSLGTIS